MNRILVIAGLALALTAGCDGYTSEARQDRLNHERGAITTTAPPSTSTTTTAPVVNSHPADVPTEDDAGWDADTSGNRRFDPDKFDCATMGNGTCDAGGIPVNGTMPPHHAGLPCAYDFADVTFTSAANEQTGRDYVNSLDTSMIACP